jgi:flagellar export protein FliJ
VAKFVFRLEAVLTQREAEERRAQIAVGALERERLAIEDEIRMLQGTLIAEKMDLRESLRDERAERVVDLRHVRLQANAALHLVNRAQRAVIRLAGVHARLDAARIELIRATTNRKAVETLKERKHEAWRDEQKRRELAASDELAGLHAARTEDAA